MNIEIARDYTDWMAKTGGFARDMTLRDHFAALAMQALIHEDIFFEDVASAGYKIADTMLKERAK